MLKPIHAGAASFAVWLAVFGASPAWADEDPNIEGEDRPAIEESYVGQVRQTPGVSTTYTFADLEARGAHGLTDLVAGNSAGLLIQPSSFNSSSLELSIRGIGGTTPHQATGESGVGVFIDGAYIARSQGLSLDLLDIETISVARGSQSILGGRNTIGGAVYMTSSKPTGEYSFEQKIQFGEVGSEFTSITHVNLPKFADILSTKISYMKHDHDGWVENLAKENFWVRDNEGLRVAFRFDQGGLFTYDYSFLDAETTSTTPYFQNLSANPGFDDSVSPGFKLPESTVDITHHSQTVTLRGEQAVLTAIVSYREVESLERAAFGGVLNDAVDLVTGNVDGFYSSRSEIDQQQFTQKLQLDTTLMDGALDLTLGLENFNEQVELAESAYQGNSEVSTLALYAQALWNLTDTMELTLGWRETSEEKELESLLSAGVDRNYREEIDDDNTNFKVGVAVEITDDLRSFISYSQGYKSGGASFYSQSLDTAFGSFSPYEAEKLESLEVGVEGDLLSGLIDFSIVAFSNDIEDKQIAISKPNNVRVTDVVNLSEDTTVEGVELEGSFEVMTGLLLSGFYSYADSEDATVIDPFSESEIDVYSAGAPKHTRSVAVDWAVGDFEAGAVKLHIEYDALSGYHFNSTNPQTDVREVVNARVSASGFQLEGDSGTIEIGVWVNNLTDSEYLLNSEDINRDDSLTRYSAGAYGEPRTYGIDFRYEL